MRHLGNGIQNFYGQLTVSYASVANVFPLTVQGGSVAGSSNGLLILAGNSNQSDRVLDVLGYNGSPRLFGVFGDGSIITGGQALLGSGIINAAGLAVGGYAVYAGVPQHQFAGGTLTASDASKHILNTAANQTFTIPANASVAYPVGTVITFVCFPAVGPITISINSDNLYWAATGGTGSRSLAASGIATAIKVATTTWIISGTGLT